MSKKKYIYITGAAIAATGLTAGFLYFLKYKKKQEERKKIVETAKFYLGQKEVSPNKNFADANFAQKMSSIGKWITGDQWCAAFTRLVWLESLPEPQRAVADKLLSKSTTLTTSNFIENAKQKDSYFEVLNGEDRPKPKAGDLVIWKSPTKAGGHAGIYNTEINGKHYVIEGNANDQVLNVEYSTIEKIYTRPDKQYLKVLIRLK